MQAKELKVGQTFKVKGYDVHHGLERVCFYVNDLDREGFEFGIVGDLEFYHWMDIYTPVIPLGEIDITEYKRIRNVVQAKDLKVGQSFIFEGTSDVATIPRICLHKFSDGSIEFGSFELGRFKKSAWYTMKANVQVLKLSDTIDDVSKWKRGFDRQAGLVQDNDCEPKS